MSLPETNQPESNEPQAPGTETGSTGGAAESTGGPSDPLASLFAERDSYKERWLRAEADLDNFRRRAQKEREEDARYRSFPLTKDLLPALDNLHRALLAAEKGNDVTQLISGVKLVAKQFDDIFARHNILPIPSVGQPFDPNLHQAVQQLPSAEHPAMSVMTEFERGYTLFDRVVRPSAVVVSSGPPA